MTTWFISDLHLDARRPALFTLLLDLLQQVSGQADALYILGDFFEYWVGDDALDAPQMAAFRPVVQALRQVSDSGVPVYFQHGNRDFLVGDAFAAMTGCELLPEQHRIDLYGEPALLLHGDSLCTDDTAYMQTRQLLRSPSWQQQFLALPLEERIRQAEAMRAQSREAMQSMDEMILDVNQQAVEATLRTADVALMIHGHTHRPATHNFLLDGQPAQRIVLGDWHETRFSYLRAESGNLKLIF